MMTDNPESLLGGALNPIPAGDGAGPVAWREIDNLTPRKSDHFIILWCREDDSYWWASWQGGMWFGSDDLGLRRTSETYTPDYWCEIPRFNEKSHDPQLQGGGTKSEDLSPQEQAEFYRLVEELGSGRMTVPDVLRFAAKAATKSAPVVRASQNIAERDPSVMPGSAGAGTAPAGVRKALEACLSYERERANLIGFSDCTCMQHSREREQEYENGMCPHQTARAALTTPGLDPATVEAVRKIIDGYADSYRMMANDGDGKVMALSVRTDLLCNMLPAIRALSPPAPSVTRADRGSEA